MAASASSDWGERLHDKTIDAGIYVNYLEKRKRQIAVSKPQGISSVVMQLSFVWTVSLIAYFVGLEENYTTKEPALGNQYILTSNE